MTTPVFWSKSVVCDTFFIKKPWNYQNWSRMITEKKNCFFKRPKIVKVHGHFSFFYHRCMRGTMWNLDNADPTKLGNLMMMMIEKILGPGKKGRRFLCILIHISFSPYKTRKCVSWKRKSEKWFSALRCVIFLQNLKKWIHFTLFY